MAGTERLQRIERQRRYRQRRKAGVRLYPVAMDRWQVQQLIDAGLLDDAALDNRDAMAEQLADAIEVMLARYV